MNYREPKLKLNKKIYVTNKVYIILRRLKKERKKSMAQIVCDLVEQNYSHQKIDTKQDGTKWNKN